MSRTVPAAGARRTSLPWAPAGPAFPRPSISAWPRPSRRSLSPAACARIPADSTSCRAARNSFSEEIPSSRSAACRSKRLAGEAERRLRFQVAALGLPEGRALHLDQRLADGHLLAQGHEHLPDHALGARGEVGDPALVESHLAREGHGRLERATRHRGGLHEPLREEALRDPDDAHLVATLVALVGLPGVLAGVGEELLHRTVEVRRLRGLVLVVCVPGLGLRWRRGGRRAACDQDGERGGQYEAVHRRSPPVRMVSVLHSSCCSSSAASSSRRTSSRARRESRVSNRGDSPSW